jgi:tetratricopeptide (TPR) repeat protein
MKTKIQTYLARLEQEPDNEELLEKLENVCTELADDAVDTELLQKLTVTRAHLLDRGYAETALSILDLELEMHSDEDILADLTYEKGRILDDELLDQQRAVETFKKVLEIHESHKGAQERLESISMKQENWKAIVDKYLEQARSGEAKQLTTSLYASAAELYQKNEPGAEEVETYLRKSLEIDPLNTKAYKHLERVLRNRKKWKDLLELHFSRSDACEEQEERVKALLAAAKVQATYLEDDEAAQETYNRVLGIDPGNSRALSALVERYTAQEDWDALIGIYKNSLKAKGREADQGMLIQIGMLCWKKQGNLEAAEPYFRRVLKVEPAQPMALNFFREYYESISDFKSLLGLLRNAQHKVKEPDERVVLGEEMARIAEQKLDDPERAIDLWKGVTRLQGEHAEAKESLKRLYRTTEKWNALLEIIKDEVDALGDEDVEAKVGRLLQMVEIYEKLRVDVMVLNTYNSILDLQPENEEVLDALAQKYESAGRINDLIGVLEKQAEAAQTTAERKQILRRIAELWSERVGNHTKAIEPLEKILEIDPGDRDALDRLHQIYKKRRNWRGLLDLYRRELEILPPDERPEKLRTMAELAQKRLGDPKTAIAIWNQVFELNPADDEAIEALMQLYQRERRWAALAEITERKLDKVSDEKERLSLLETLGVLWSDRIGGTKRAIDVWREVLSLRPGHNKATRVLRDLYARDGDWKALEDLFAEQGNWTEFIDTLHHAADRTEDKDTKVALYFKVAAVWTERLEKPERAVKAYERVLSAEPDNLEAARELVPIYVSGQKWPRLLTTYEVLLKHTEGVEDQIELLRKIWELCEQKLGSKADAFNWCAKAYKLMPDDRELEAELERLAGEAHSWKSLVDLYRERVEQVEAEEEKVRLFRKMADFTLHELSRPEEAQGYYQEVLERRPEDRSALDALEQIFSLVNDWKNLLGIYEKRAELEEAADAEVEVLFKAGMIQEEKLEDLAGAAEVYARIIELDPTNLRALRALERIYEARSEWQQLVDVLSKQLALMEETVDQVALLYRLGQLNEERLEDTQKALEVYKRALDLDPLHRQTVSALEKYLQPEAEHRVAVAEILSSYYERTEAWEELSQTLEVLLNAYEDARERREIMKRLSVLYGRKLGDVDRALTNAVRIFEDSPEDAENRETLRELADLKGTWEPVIEKYGSALENAEGNLRCELAWELAQIYDEALRQPEQARGYYQQVLEIDEAHEGAFEALRRILSETEEYGALRELLHRRADLLMDADARKELLFQVSNLDEDVLNDNAAAINCYKEILEIDPGNARAFSALERLYASGEKWDELAALLEQELGYNEDPEKIADLQYRRGEIMATRLDNAEGAVDIFREVLSIVAGHEKTIEALEGLLENEGLRQRVAGILEPLYAEREQWTKLVGILEVRLEATEGDAIAAVDLLARIAGIQTERIGDSDAAFATWRRALKLQPGDERVRAALDMMIAEAGRWEDAIEVYGEGLEAASPDDLPLRSEFTLKLAKLFEEKILDPDRAAHWYRQLLELDPANLEMARLAASSLIRLYETAADWEKLVQILRREVDWSEDIETRKKHLFRIAEIQEQYLSAEDDAIETYKMVVDLDPEDHQALDSLERLYLRGERWTELVEILRRRADVSMDPDERRQLWSRIAMLYEEALDDRDEAIRAWSSLLDENPDDMEAIRSLSRLYESASRWRDLFDMLDRELALTEDEPSQVALTFRIGQILHKRLEDAERAIFRYREVLEKDRDHTAARQALEQLLSDDLLAMQAAEILEPLYAAESNWEKLCDIHELKAQNTADPAEKVALYKRIAEIKETGLDDSRAAFDYYGKALREAVGLPELTEIMSAVERLAENDNRWADLVELYKNISDDILDLALQEKMRLTVADVARHRLGDLDTAREFYRGVLDTSGDNIQALDALESLYAETEEFVPLLGILKSRADLEAEDDKKRRDYLARAALLCDEVLERPEEAISLWEQVMGVSPGDRQAADALERLYSGGERWADLAELLERRLGFAETIEEAVNLRYRLGLLWEDQLSDPDRALTNFRAALGGNPAHAESIGRIERFLEDEDRKGDAAEILEPIYASRQDWPRLIEIYKIRRQATDAVEMRPGFTRRIAQLYEEQMEDLDQAFDWYGHLFTENPQEPGIRGQLTRLAGILDRWEHLSKVYAEYLEGVFEETPISLEVARELAEIYDEKLNEVDKAKAAYNRVLSQERGNKEVFAALERMLSRAEKWEDLLEVYREASDHAFDVDERKSLLFRICHIWEEPLDNAEEAINAYRSILDLGDNDPNAIKSLERLLSFEQRWTDLVELYHRELEFAAEEEKIVELKLKLGNLHREKLDDLPAAIDAFEEVLRIQEANESAIAALEKLILDEDHRFRIAQILEPIYKRLGEWKKLVVIYDAELEFIDDRIRRVEILNEIATLHEEQGGDLSLAFDAMAKAWQEDVADPEVFDRLERLAGKLGDWQRLVSVLEKGVEGSYDTELLAKVWGKIARIHEEALRDPEKAVEAYNKLLSVKDDSQVAITALERLLPDLNRYEELVPILKRKAELTPDPLESVEVFYKLAEVQESVLENVPEAIETWRQVLMLNDEDELALGALERLYKAQEAWTELSEIYGRKIDLVDDPAEKRDYYFKLADVQENKLEESFEAIAAYGRVLENAPEDIEALKALNRLYTKEKLWPDLLDVLERQIGLEADERKRNDLLYHAGMVMQKELSDYDGAIERYRQVLEADPNHTEARTALEELAHSDTAREQAVAVLEPLLRNAGEWRSLAELYELRLESETEPTRRVEMLLALAQITETGVGDRAGAFEAYGRALAEDPGNESVQGQLERLAHEDGSWAQLAQLYGKLLENIYDGELGQKLSTTLARVYEEALSDDEKAIKHYRKALEFSPENTAVLAALDRLLSKTEKWDELAEILQREVDATTDPEPQADFLYRLGALRLTQFGDKEGAITAFSETLNRQPEHLQALEALEGMLADPEKVLQVLDILEPIYEMSQKFEKQLALGRKRLELLEDRFEKAQLLERIAELAENRLQQPDEALRAMGEALAYNPAEPRYLEQLERLADLTGQWEDACRIAGAVLEGTEDENVVRDVGLRVARWYVDRLTDMDTAEALYKRVLEVDNVNADALDALEAIYRAKMEVEPLMGVLEKKAELILDVDARKAVLREMADLAENTLRDPAAAARAWKAIAELDESDREAQDALIRLYESAEQWEELVDALNSKSRFVDDSETLTTLKHRAGQVLMEKLEDTDRAIEVYKDALDHEPQDSLAMDALENIYAGREEWTEVQDILLRRMAGVDEERARVPIYVKLAALAEEKFENTEEAISYWLQIKQIDEDYEEAYGQLERLFEKEERWFDLADIHGEHATLYGRTGQSDLEVAQLVKASHIWESKLDNAEKATEMMEKILEREPGNVAALNGLARIYESLEEWEKCKEVLAQAAAAGPTGRDGAELYFRQGRVEAQLGHQEQALEYYEKALELDETHPEALETLEKWAREKEDWQKVAKLVHVKAKHATEASAQLQYLCELGNIFSEKLAQPEHGLPFLEQALEIAPDDADVLEPLANLYFAAGRDEDAERLYRGLVEQLSKTRDRKKMGRLQYRLGALSERRGDTAEALKAYDQSYRIDTTFAPTLVALGRLYKAEEKWDKARRIYRSMLLQNIDEKETGVSKADIYHSLGFIHYKCGEEKKARNMLQRGLELNSEHAEIKALLEQIQG